MPALPALVEPRDDLTAAVQQVGDPADLLTVSHY